MNKSILRIALSALALFGVAGLASVAYAQAAVLDIWWPVNNATVGGVQPFKGLVTGAAIDSYTMYWQVDGGQLNRMDNDYRDYPHKEAAVDLSGWTWRTSGEYTVKFVAKNSEGAVIAEKPVTIYANKLSGASAPVPAGTNAVPQTGTTVTAKTITAALTGSASVADASTAVVPAETSILWPADGATVSGTQTFKARVPNVDLRKYSMYWQVDGGQPNSMSDNRSDGGFKEASVSFSNWNWRGAGPYEVTFVAKDSKGKIMSKKSVKIYVGGTTSPSTITVAAPVVSTSASLPLPPPPAPAPIPALAPTPAPAPAPVLVSSPSPVVQGNPLSGIAFFLDPNNPARRQADQWRSSRPTDAVQMDKIASQPGARWFGNWNGNIREDVRAYVDSAAARGEVPVMIAYNIPQRDCGSYSAGGVGSPDAYRAWIREFADGIGTRKAVVILEPDAIVLTDCLSSADKTARFNLIKEATGILKANGKTLVYLDSGHSNWLAAGDMATRLKDAGVASADGFALNVSNFEPTSNLITYGTTISSQIGGKHFVVDTSRNGLGSNGQWCNPEGRALGSKVTTATGNSLVDAFLWLKVPGESDGTCNGGPSAGTWWPEFALGLAQRAAY